MGGGGGGYEPGRKGEGTGREGAVNQEKKKEFVIWREAEETVIAIAKEKVACIADKFDH